MVIFNNGSSSARLLQTLGQKERLKREEGDQNDLSFTLETHSAPVGKLDDDRLAE